MKKILILTLGLVTAITAAAAQKYLRVVSVQGDPVYFHVDGKPAITTAGNTLSVGAIDDAPMSFEMDGISHIDFVDEAPNAIALTEAENGVRVSRSGWQVSISGLADNTPLTVVAIDGTVVLQHTVSQTATIDMNGLPKGTYIIKTKNLTFKILL